MCSDFESLNSKKLEKINYYHSEVSKWENDLRMQFIKSFYDPLNEQFDLIHGHIKLNDQKSFAVSKQSIKDLINEFLKRTKIDNWTNNEYFWILDDCIEELNELELGTVDGCSNDQLHQCLEIENTLFSTLYLTGYNDQFCFNKSELEREFEAQSELTDFRNLWINEQSTPMRALPLQTTLFHNSASRQVHETCTRS